MLNQNDSMLIMIDVQDKLTDMLNAENKFQVENNALKIIKAADILNIKTIITEQYPKGLGATIKPVRDFLGERYQPFEKTSFSILNDEKISNEIQSSNKKQIILFGIESHICVFQSAVELKEKNYETAVISDISFSRDNMQKFAAIEAMRASGIKIMTLEMVLFMWLKTAKHPDFKTVQALIK